MFSQLREVRRTMKLVQRGKRKKSIGNFLRYADLGPHLSKIRPLEEALFRMIYR